MFLVVSVHVEGNGLKSDVQLLVLCGDSHALVRQHEYGWFRCMEFLMVTQDD